MTEDSLKPANRQAASTRQFSPGLTCEKISHTLLGDHSTINDRVDAARALVSWIGDQVVVDSLLIAANPRCEPSAAVRLAAIKSLGGSRLNSIAHTLRRFRLIETDVAVLTEIGALIYRPAGAVENGA